jgi:hypothetical protein
MRYTEEAKLVRQNMTIDRRVCLQASTPYMVDRIADFIANTALDFRISVAAGTRKRRNKC